MSFRMAVGVVVGTFMVHTSAAHGAFGSIIDPADEFEDTDIVRLSYSNERSRVVISMIYRVSRPQNEQFGILWGSKGARYEANSSPSVGANDLYYRSGTRAQSMDLECKGMRFKRTRSRTTTAIIPRRCLGHAPGTLRFQGVASGGFFHLDSTRISKEIRRG